MAQAWSFDSYRSLLPSSGSKADGKLLSCFSAPFSHIEQPFWGPWLKIGDLPATILWNRLKIRYSISIGQYPLRLFWCQLELYIFEFFPFWHLEISFSLSLFWIQLYILIFHVDLAFQRVHVAQGYISPFCLIAWIKSLVNDFLILFSTLSTKIIWGQIILLLLKILFIFKVDITCIWYDIGKTKKGIHVFLRPVPYLPHPVCLHRYNQLLVSYVS